jgi:DNA-binding transcriptional regulator LsrR (DeoR family)
VANDRHDRLAQAAYLYYVQDQSQAEIARVLGVTRSNVSRMLRAAREQSIIRFEIAYPFRRNAVLERDLRRRFAGAGLREVVVPAAHGILAVGHACCRWLDLNLHGGERIGLGYGETVESMVSAAHFENRFDVEVLQIAGELSVDARYSGHDLVRSFAEKLGGSYRYFDAPAMTPDEQTAQALIHMPRVADALEMGRRSDIAIASIGAFAYAGSGQFLRRAEATEQEVEEARAAGAVGQISGRFFDERGKQLDLALDRRLISIDLEDIRRINTVVGLGSGEFKARAIRAALQGDLIDVLIVDEPLAAALMDTGGEYRNKFGAAMATRDEDVS